MLEWKYEHRLDLRRRDVELNASICLMNRNSCHLDTTHTHTTPTPCPTPEACLAHPRPQGSVGVVASRLVRLRAIGLDTAALKSVTLVSPAYLQVLEVGNTRREIGAPKLPFSQSVECNLSLAHADR